MSAQREAFEVHAERRGLPFNCYTFEPFDYCSSATHEAWIAWQAAQAAMPVDRASRVPMRVVEIMRERFSSGDDVVVFARAIEKHHGIGAKP